MVRYDSEAKILYLERRYQLNGELPVSTIGKVSLQELTNSEQQRLISVAKLCVQFALGHNISDPRNAKDKVGGDIQLPSHVLSTQTLLNRKPTVKTPKATTNSATASEAALT
jgi:hypothetical protein